MIKFYRIFYESVNFYTLLLIFILSSSIFKSQSLDTLKPLFNYSIKTEYGTLMKTNYYIKNLPTKNYAGYSFQILKQTTGKKMWERMYRNPSYGFGLNYVDFLDNQQIGHPFAIYSIFSNKIKQWNRFSWDYYVNFGASFNAKPFDQKNNYLNISFGSKTNLYIGIGSMIKYNLGNYFDIGLGLGMNHLSNGSLKSPNKGLNFGGPQLMLAYHPKIEKTNDIDISDSEKYDQFKTIELSFFGGRKHAFYRGEYRSQLPGLYDGFNYNVYGIEGLYTKQYSYKSAVGIALGITYDGNYNHTMYVVDQTLYETKRFRNDNLLISIMPTYRIMINNLYVNIQAGYYPFKKIRDDDKSRFFQKVSLQYQFSPRFFASFGINAFDFHRANYLEWKLGYTISKMRRKN